jgi:hypothetical protein
LLKGCGDFDRRQVMVDGLMKKIMRRSERSLRKHSTINSLLYLLSDLDELTSDEVQNEFSLRKLLSNDLGRRRSA